MPNIKRKLCIMKLNAFFEILSSSGLKGLMEYHVSRALFPRIILIAFVLRLDIKEKKVTPQCKPTKFSYQSFLFVLLNKLPVFYLSDYLTL